MPYIIPADDLTLQQRMQFRADIDAKLQERATRVKSLGRVEELIIRDVFPGPDLGIAGIAGAATNFRWLTAALVADTAQNYVNAAVATTQIVGFYGIANLSPTASINTVFFRVGAAAGSTRQAVTLEQLYSRMEPIGYLDVAVLYDPQEWMQISIVPGVAVAAREQLILLSRIIEPVGAVISGAAL